MAEVVEINLICNNKVDTKMLLSFINCNAKGNVENRTIEVIDNWEYENRRTISSEEEISGLVEDKIICITEKYSSGYAGLNVEKVYQKYCYTIWFNILSYDEIVQYNYLLKEFILFFKENICNTCVLCSIGKEIIFEYICDCYKEICNSHNIDVWIILDNEYENVLSQDSNILQQYRVEALDDFFLLCKKQVLICDK